MLPAAPATAAGPQAFRAEIGRTVSVLQRLLQGRRAAGADVAEFAGRSVEEQRPVTYRRRVYEVIADCPKPVIAAGKVAVNPGTISAAADEFRVSITGKGGHGSSPHKSVDAIMVAAIDNASHTIASLFVTAIDMPSNLTDFTMAQLLVFVRVILFLLQSVVFPLNGRLS